MIRCIVISLCLCCITTFTKAQLADSLRRHIDSALHIMQQSSLYTQRVNWPAVQQQVYHKGTGATTKAATFPAIVYAFQQLKDHHGMFTQYDSQYRHVDSSAIKRYTPALLNEWKKGWKIKAEILNGVAYLRMPNIPAFNPQQITFYTNLLSDSIARLAAANPKAWILDLRMNAGGAIQPMLAALAPFFEDGIVSWYVNNRGQATDPYAFNNGKLVITGYSTIAVQHVAPPMHSTKIAVLTGPGTGSSGEICAAILKQRQGTRLFGALTAGECNSTEGFVFNNNESYLLLTTQHLADKYKRPLPHQVIPHVQVTGNDAFTNLLRDDVVKAALNWLQR
jgi:carboxyl-terminal processing protease